MSETLYDILGIAMTATDREIILGKIDLIRALVAEREKR